MISTQLIGYMALLGVLLVRNNHSNNAKGTVVPVHAVKAYKGRSLALDGSQCTTLHPGRFLPGEKRTVYTLNVKA
jgi:hypothetical protein